MGFVLISLIEREGRWVRADEKMENAQKMEKMG